MKTLRKEIEDSLKYRLNDYNTIYYKDITNDILKLFDKRIDKDIKIYDNLINKGDENAIMAKVVLQGVKEMLK